MNNQNNDVNIIGYSERGIVSSLMYEMVMDDNSKTLFEELLNLFNSMSGDEKPIKPDSKFQITGVEVLLEHSFSDFGDADIVILIDTEDGKKHCVFVEAKISNNQRNKSLSDHYDKFIILDDKNRKKQNKKEKKDSSFSSNLFTQLYHKKVLADALRKSNYLEILQKGLVFPQSSTTNPRKIGTNDVVLTALEKVREYALDENSTWYLALIPEGPKGDFKDVIKPPHKDYTIKSRKWDTSHYGYITWEIIEKFCREKEKHFKHSIKVFEHNCTLIFSENTIKKCTEQKCSRIYSISNERK